MLELIIILFVYTVIVLLFVPLDKIGKYQLRVKAEVEKIMKRINK